MPITHHPLIEEFSEYKDAIHDLKLNNAHFRRLAHEYEGIDKSIFRAEQGIEVAKNNYVGQLSRQH